MKKSPPICTIKWNVLTLSEWEQRFTAIMRSSVMQSYAYAKAICALDRQTARWGLIEMDGYEAGIIQILEAKAFFGAAHGIIIDRGPLWFEKFGKAEHLDAFLEELLRQYPRRFGRRFRLIPEMKDCTNVRDTLSAHGFTARGEESGYETIWLDLSQDLEDLRAGLKKNWRGTLKKAEKSQLSVERDSAALNLEWLLQRYTQDRLQKRYRGAHPKSIRALAKTMVPENTFHIFRALTNDKPIAAILLLCHGRSATYQLGWTSQEGRDTGAHHLLLWRGLEFLKEQHIYDFDLGGVNDEQSQGIKAFKSGMGGTLVCFPGLYT